MQLLYLKHKGFFRNPYGLNSGVALLSVSSTLFPALLSATPQHTAATEDKVCIGEELKINNMADHKSLVLAKKIFEAYMIMKKK